MKRRISLGFATSLFLLAACQGGEQPAKAPADEAADSAAPATPSESWPASLTVVGDGYPAAGDACRIIGESAATADYLDDSATLVGCRLSEDAATLGGSIVGTVDGVTLVSVPARKQASAPEAPPAAGGDVITLGNMPAYCRGEVSEMYGTRPVYVKTGPISKTAAGSTIDGTVDKGDEGIKEFRCKFDAGGRFIEVMAMTSDGE